MPRTIRRCAAVLLALLVTLPGCAGRPNPVPEGAIEQQATAAVVMANTRLFREGSRDLPALIVFSLDPTVPFGELRALAKQLYSMRGTQPADDDLEAVAAMVNDVTYRGDAFAKVPERLGYGRQTYVAPIVVQRERLSAGYLRPKVTLKIRVYLRGDQPYTARLISDAP